jgi:hypothetical protein
VADGKNTARQRWLIGIAGVLLGALGVGIAVTIALAAGGVLR